MEELLDLKTQYETLEQEEIIKIIDFISKDKTTMTSTKYLVDNFEKVKLKTITDFWTELAEKLQKRFNAEIEFVPKVEYKLGYEYFEYSFSENKIFELHFTLNLYHQQGKGIRIKKGDYKETEIKQLLNSLKMFIGSEIGHWLYLGVKNHSNNEISNSSMKIFEKKNLFKFIFDKQEWRRDIFSDTNERIKLSDFSHQATFDLIDKQKRETKIKQIVEEIEFHLQRYNGIITEND